MNHQQNEMEVIEENHLQKPIERWKKIFCTVSIIPPIAFYILVYKILPGFAQTFSGFEVQLPMETLIIFYVYPYLPLLFIISFFPIIIWINSLIILKLQNVIFNISVAHVCFIFFSFPFLVWALYAPINK